MLSPIEMTLTPAEEDRSMKRSEQIFHWTAFRMGCAGFAWERWPGPWQLGEDPVGTQEFVAPSRPTSLWRCVEHFIVLKNQGYGCVFQ